jgi:hypothetical protein
MPGGDEPSPLPKGWHKTAAGRGRYTLKPVAEARPITGEAGGNISEATSRRRHPQGQA